MHHDLSFASTTHEHRVPAGRNYVLPVTIFFFSLLTLLLAASERLLQDPDTFWHIAVGERLWRTGIFPRTDELSHTFAGSPWIAKEWLSQLILYGSYAIAGWSGVAFVTAATIASSLSLLLVWFLRRVKMTVSLDLIFAVIILSCYGFTARPLIFFHPLLILWVGGLISAREKNTSPSFWLIPVLALWANLHASFTIAFVVASLFGLEAIATAERSARQGVATRWGAFGLAALASTGITPYGYEPLFITFKLFGDNEAVHYISEWQPLEFDLIGICAAAALIGSLGILLISPRRNFWRILLISAIGSLMIRHMRFTGLFAIVDAMSLVGPLVHHFPALRARKFQGRLNSRIKPALGLAALISTTAVVTFYISPKPKAENTPFAALAAAMAAGVSGPVFNDYDFGGYLISQGYKTFIDGRSDQLFGGGFFKSLAAAEESKTADEFYGILDRYGCTWALVKSKSKAQAKIGASARWVLIYQDEFAAVYTRKVGQAL
ncbi:hypothetical protein [Methylobacterium nodulans]|uniref:Glycosyltransferase RgtA/B/C/D-like domain-containing protein n=1 Tax=Methylobacterium nodulans (strain LMG 21967 / CNCM I-2342 / ORS 2060) TaxID=460265 RepID=B8IDZ6_METNO|nr:hypothetical protein [Methylobacterium nodulans]ACL57542.1 conserved hypothetical protein [Methylobacterium nodulans ORS 2060]